MCNKATIARTIDSIRVGSAVQQQLDDGYSVGTSGENFTPTDVLKMMSGKRDDFNSYLFRDTILC